MPPAGGQRPVFPLDVQRDGRSPPGKQGRQDEAHPLAGTGGRETQDVFRPVVPQIEQALLFRVPPAAHVDALAVEITHVPYLLFRGPARGSVQDGVAPEQPHGHDAQQHEDYPDYLVAFE